MGLKSAKISGSAVFRQVSKTKDRFEKWGAGSRICYIQKKSKRKIKNYNEEERKWIVSLAKT